MTRRIVMLVFGIVLGAVSLAGCAYDNGNGGTEFVAPPASIVALAGGIFYLPCATATGCDLDGNHYAQGELVPLPNPILVSVPDR